VAAVGATGAAPSPYLGSELLPFFLWGFVDDPSAGIISATGVLECRINIFSECAGAGVAAFGFELFKRGIDGIREPALARIVLPGSDSSASSGQSAAFPNVARFAEISQVSRRGVALITVLVVDNHKAT
jgi:hypothetical protein